MKKALLGYALILFAFSLIALPAYAQVDPSPTPVVTPAPTPDPGAGLFSLFIGPSPIRYVGIAGAIFLFIAGLKNTPGTADFFAKWPKLAVVTNALVSLATQLGICLGVGGHVEGFPFLNCILGAVGLFLGAAGIHLVKFDLSPTKETRGGDGVAHSALSPAVSRKTRDTLGVRPLR